MEVKKSGLASLEVSESDTSGIKQVKGQGKVGVGKEVEEPKKVVTVEDKLWIKRFMVFISISLVLSIIACVIIHNSKVEYDQVLTNNWTILKTNPLNVFTLAVQYEYKGQSYASIVYGVPSKVLSESTMVSPGSLRIFINPNDLSKVHLVEESVVPADIFTVFIIVLICYLICYYNRIKLMKHVKTGSVKITKEECTDRDSDVSDSKKGTKQ